MTLTALDGSRAGDGPHHPDPLAESRSVAARVAALGASGHVWGRVDVAPERGGAAFLPGLRP
jgi:hypothetical protein